MFPRTVALVNSVLMLSADTPLAVADIARAALVAYTPARSALTTLEKRGLVLRSARAGHEEFEPNTHDAHYPMAYASALVDLPLGEAVRGQRVYAIYAYGSAARPGGGTRWSDLDLMIVSDIKNQSTITERLNEIGRRLHRAIDPFYIEPEQFERAKERADPQVASALAGVRIMGSV